MRFIIFLSLVFFVSCSVNKQGDDTTPMTMTMDLSSIGLSKAYRIIPATFETVTDEVLIIDKVVRDGFYKEKKHKRLVKDGYSTIRTIPNHGTITYNKEILLSYSGYESVKLEEEYKNYSTYHYCKSCDSNSGISYKDVHKAAVKNSTRDGQPYKRMMSSYKLVQDAQVEASYSDGSEIIKVTGTRSQLEKLLKNPKLKGVKHQIKKL